MDRAPWAAKGRGARPNREHRLPKDDRNSRYDAHLAYLFEGLLKNDCTLYAFVLMTDQVQLLAPSAAPVALSRLILSLGRRGVRYVKECALESSRFSGKSR